MVLLRKNISYFFFIVSTFFFGQSTENDSIFLEYKSELESAKKENSLKNIAQKQLQLGDFCYNHELFSEAINYYNKALENTTEINATNVTLHNKIGRVYLSINNYTKAFNYFTKALSNAKKINFTNGKAIALGLIGTCFEKKSDYLESIKHQKESLALFTELKDSAGIAMVNENIGSIYEDLTKYNQAYNYFIKSYNYLKGSNTKQEANVLNNLGDAYRKRGFYKEAINYTQKALNVAEKIKDNHQIESAYKDLSKTYVLLNNYKKAFEYREKSEYFKELTLKKQNIKQLNILQTIYDTNKKEAQISALKEKSNLQAANQNLLIVVLLATVALLITLWSFFDRKRKTKAKVQAYKQKVLQTELEKKEIEEANLQKDIQVKTSSLSKYSLHLSQKNKILSDISGTLKNIVERNNLNYKSKLKELTKEIDFNLRQENEWIEFNDLFKNIHPNFTQKLSEVSTENLSPSELKLSMLLRLNLSSKEIASILRVTPDSVRVARYRLRKKLPIKAKKELVNFMLEL